MAKNGNAKHWIEGGIARLAYEGELDFELLAGAHQGIAADPAFYPEIPKLIDLRRVTKFHTFEEFLKVSEVTAGLHADAKRRRRVAVVSGDVMVEKLSRLYQEASAMRGATNPPEYWYFASLEAAETWLREGLPRRAAAY